MKLDALLTLIWRRADRGDRASLVFHVVALVVIGLGFFVDIAAWVYVLIAAGIMTTVIRSFIGYRKSYRELQKSLTDYQRVREIEYFEWLHDASPDD